MRNYTYKNKFADGREGGGIFIKNPNRIVFEMKMEFYLAAKPAMTA